MLYKFIWIKIDFEPFRPADRPFRGPEARMNTVPLNLFLCVRVILLIGKQANEFCCFRLTATNFTNIDREETSKVSGNSLWGVFFQIE